MAKEVNDAAAQKLEKLKILQSTLDKIEKSYGKGSIMKLGDRPVEEMDVISTGSISLDAALGVGGFPRGRVIETFFLAEEALSHVAQQTAALLFARITPNKVTALVISATRIASLIFRIEFTPVEQVNLKPSGKLKFVFVPFKKLSHWSAFSCSLAFSSKCVFVRSKRSLFSAAVTFANTVLLKSSSLYKSRFGKSIKALER